MTTLGESTVGSVTTAPVTIVVTDADDQLPVFSSDSVSVSVPEDLGRKLKKNFSSYFK